MQIKDLVLQRRLNPRKKIDGETVERYVQIIDDLPPIIVQGTTGVLIDGWHRVEAARRLGLTELPAEEIDVADNDLFAEAVRRNLGHGLALTKAERNDAIVKLYREGYTQEAVGEMFGIDQGNISRVVGALERTERICVTHKEKGIVFNTNLTPAHEEKIRKAPKPLQDKIAEVVLTREDSTPESTQAEIPLDDVKAKPKPKSKPLTVSQTNTLVGEINQNPAQAEELLDHLLDNPQESRIVGTHADGSIDSETVAHIIDETKRNPGIVAEWARLISQISDFMIKYEVGELVDAICDEKHSDKNASGMLLYFEKIVAKQRGTI
ncbi:MAG: ParB N-terminal domain-containing protein [Candidatus Poribacteria bacterium]|nr:ParB N-terminal domain-containing protein [Candidatus Poribacteria bacterium]